MLSIKLVNFYCRLVAIMVVKDSNTTTTKQQTPSITTTTKQQTLEILIILITIVKEIAVTTIIIFASIVIATLTHQAILIVLSLRALRHVINDVTKRTHDVINKMAPAVLLTTEVFFHCLGVVVAMGLAVLSQMFMISLLSCHLVWTVAVRLKQSRRRKRYLRRVVKVTACVGFVVALTYVVRERSVVMEMTEEYGKRTIPLVLGYMMSGRGTSSQ